MPYGGTAWHPLADGDPPSWAGAWGEDRYGVWVAFTIGEATQRLRWIRPGRFTMGSPEDEAVRFDDEGPRHEVTIGRGFWLFDTPCTQALWQVVMGTNPSRFQTADRPVEQVSWDDVQAFLGRLNGMAPGLDLVLPSEAQWEYACRAGTEAATYAGDMAILGERNAPNLDPIAWYGGNSGEGFELEDGLDSSDWREKQYPHKKAGTRPVALKEPNAWGLYDMLGNVWEWCADHWHDSYEGAPTDGAAWINKDTEARRGAGGARRLVGRPRAVRAVCLPGLEPPDARFGDLGFRCSRVQA